MLEAWSLAQKSDRLSLKDLIRLFKVIENNPTEDIFHNKKGLAPDSLTFQSLEEFAQLSRKFSVLRESRKEFLRKRR